MEPTKIEETVPISAPDKISNKPERHPVSPQLYQLRRYFVYVLVGGLIITALIAIIAALFGNTSSLIGKSVETVIMVTIHSLFALGFMSITSTKQPNKGSSIVISTLFGITVLSLVISTLGTWELITDGAFILRTYAMLFTAFVTSLVMYGLFQSNENDKATVISRNTAIGSSLVLFGMLVPVIYSVNNIHEFYYRLLTAVSIAAGVSIVITVIFHWYYMSKHPELRPEEKTSEPMSAGTMIVRGVLVLFGIWILTAILLGIYRGIDANRDEPMHRTPTPARYY